MAPGADVPHLPRPAPIEAYGNGGFAFADMSHRGSLLCLPDAIWAWPVEKPEQIDRASLDRVFAAAGPFVIGATSRAAGGSSVALMSILVWVALVPLAAALLVPLLVVETRGRPLPQ